MVDNNYCPDRGDVIWLDFNPQLGFEQKGRRPALVISPYSYNNKVGLIIVLPITSQIKGYPFEVKLPLEFNVKGVILADQVKSLDWKQRKAAFIDKINDNVLKECLNKLNKILA